MLGIHILGMVSEGGGGNEILFCTMVDDLSRIGSWPENNCVCFKNTIHPTKIIYVWSCGIHFMKALRDNIYCSQLQYVQNLKHSNIHFGWNNVEKIYIYIRDKARV